MMRIPSGRRWFLPVKSTPHADAKAIDDEMRFHIEMRIDELMTTGASETDARATAAREFGDSKRYKSDCLTIDSRFARERRMRGFAESGWADLRHAARSLRRQLGFAAVAIGTLALGIGATTSIFSVVSGVLLRPLPYADADRIVHLGQRDIAKPGPGANTSVDDYLDWRRSSRSFSAMGVLMNSSPTLTGQGDAEQVSAALVSSGILDVFHLRPVLGRPFVASDDAPGSALVALLSYEFWKGRFGGDSGIVGKTIQLNSSPVQVIGVLPRFAGPGRLDRQIWENFTSYADGRSNHSESVWALLRPGATRAQAQREMTRIADGLARLYPEDKDRTIVVDPIIDLIVGDLARPLYVLLGASFFVLVIACANLSNLLLARGLARRHEVAVRYALGAARGRIARQLLTESLLLAILGGVAAIFMARGVIAMLVELGPAVFRVRPPALSLDVLAAALALTGVTTLLVGVIPALRTAPGNTQGILRESGTRTTGRRTGRTRATLAIAQLSLAVVLLSGCALVIKSFVRVLTIDPGIRPDHLLTMNVSLPQNSRFDGLASTMFHHRLVERLSAVPGVSSAATTSLLPFSGDEMLFGITRILGQPERFGGATILADRYMVSPGYFATMGIQLLRGRGLAEADRSDAPLVCVVDEVFARRAFGSRDAVGQSIQLAGRDGYARIVGVVKDVKSYGLDAESLGQIYVSSEQYPWRWMSLVLRTKGDPSSVTAAARRAVRELDPNQPVTRIATMESLMADLLKERRFTLTLLVIFAMVAIVLATIGLYGVIAYGVAERRREFSVRMALGAQRLAIARIVLSEGAAIAVAGTAVGSVCALITNRLITSLLFEVSARDAVVLVAVSVGLTAVALATCLLPAYRATTVDPARILRGD
jgi:putative ABC transport system permease protein